MARETQTVGPPPAAEVALRTLESDAKSIAAGEISPQAEIVHPTAVSTAPTKAAAQEQPKKKSKFWLWVVIFVVVVVIVVVAIFAFLFPSADSTSVEITTDAEL